MGGKAFFWFWKSVIRKLDEGAHNVIPVKQGAMLRSIVGSMQDPVF